MPPVSSSADWFLVVITGLAAGVPALLAVGGLWAKVARLEADVRTKVSRELFDAEFKHVSDQLRDIKSMLRRALGEVDTQP